MCYSALVKQNVKKLGAQFKARIHLDAFEELFQNRKKGSGAKISRAMELSFSNPECSQEKRIWMLIEEWRG